MQAAQPRELGVLQARGSCAAHAPARRASASSGSRPCSTACPAHCPAAAARPHAAACRPRVVRIGQPDRLHRPEAQRLAAALGHHLDRQAAVEVGRGLLPLLERGLLARQQRVDERLVLRPAHRTVEVVGARAARPRLVVARLLPGDARSRSSPRARSARWHRRTRAHLRRSAAGWQPPALARSAARWRR